MKRNIHIATFILFIIIGIAAKGQNIQGLLIGGMNLSQVDGDEVYGFKKAGLNLGVGAALPFGEKKRWAFNIETCFSQKGAFEKYPNEAYDSMKLPYYNLRLHYAEIPAYISYKDKNGLTFGAGFSLARLTGMKEIEHGKTKDWSMTNQPYDRFDYNIFADVRFKIYGKLYFNFRYSYSIDKIRTRNFQTLTSSWKREQFNNNLTFRLLFLFNEKNVE